MSSNARHVPGRARHCTIMAGRTTLPLRLGHSSSQGHVACHAGHVLDMCGVERVLRTAWLICDPYMNCIIASKQDIVAWSSLEFVSIMYRASNQVVSRTDMPRNLEFVSVMYRAGNRVMPGTPARALALARSVGTVCRACAVPVPALFSKFF